MVLNGGQYNMHGEVPIGTIVAWVKSFANTPQTLAYGWVECNGQVLSDPQSVFNGATIPSLNSSTGAGVKTVVGATSSGTTHHQIFLADADPADYDNSFYTVVMIMRVK
jgi:hypothetical protein